MIHELERVAPLLSYANIRKSFALTTGKQSERLLRPREYGEFRPHSWGGRILPLAKFAENILLNV